MSMVETRHANIALLQFVVIITSNQLLDNEYVHRQSQTYKTYVPVKRSNRPRRTAHGAVLLGSKPAGWHSITGGGGGGGISP